MICTSPQANGILNSVPDRILHEDEESSKKKFENHHNSETHNIALKHRLKAPKCYDDKLFFFPLLCVSIVQTAAAAVMRLFSMKFHNVDFPFSS